MTIISAKAADHPRDWMPVAQTSGGFVHYLSMLREAFTEALEQTQAARRKYPFADV